MHKPTPIGRPIISGCDGQTELETLHALFILQAITPIAKIQELFLKKNSTNFVENTGIPEHAIIVSLMYVLTYLRN